MPKDEIKQSEVENESWMNEPSKFVSAITRYTFKFLLILLLNVKSHRSKDIDELDGPVVVVGNHISAIDPFVMGAFVSKRWVHYVTSQSYFEIKIVEKILRYFGAVPKRQGLNDIRTAKYVLRILRAGGVIGIFPEGARTIDGTMHHFNNSLAKLIKQTKSNVVVSHMNCASISMPRWYRGVDRGFRRGTIINKSFVLFTKEEIANLSIEKIDKALREALYYSEYDWQKKHRIPFHSRRMAEGMHAILHKCPKCLKDYATDTKKNLLFCKYCDNRVIVDKYGLLNPESEHDISFENMSQWRAWQNKIIQQELQDPEYMLRTEGMLYIKDSFGVITNTYNDCIMELTHKEIRYIAKEENIVIPLVSVTDAIADYSWRFEINLDKNSYQFTPENGQMVIKITDIIKYKKGIL